MSDIVISSMNTSNGLLFYISSGVTGVAYYRWYLNDTLVGFDSTYLLTTSVSGATIYVDIDQQSDSIWYDGQFYGGTFNGNFLGGQFYYGYLNGTYYPYQNIKPKQFIS